MKRDEWGRGVYIKYLESSPSISFVLFCVKGNLLSEAYCDTN